MFWRRLSVDLVELSFGALDILGEGLMKEHGLNYIQREQNSNLPLPMDTRSSTLRAMSRSTKKQSSKHPVQLGTLEKKALISVKKFSKESNSLSHYNTTTEDTTTNRQFSLPKDCKRDGNRSNKSRALRRPKQEATVQESECVDNLKQQLIDRSASRSGWKLLTSVQHKLIRDMGKSKEQKQNSIMIKNPPLQSLNMSLQNSPKIKFNDLFSIKRASQLRNSVNQSVHRQMTDKMMKGIVFKEKKISQKMKQRLRVLENKPLTFQKQIKMRGSWMKEWSSLHNLVNFSSEEGGWQTFIEKEM